MASWPTRWHESASCLPIGFSVHWTWLKHFRPKVQRRLESVIEARDEKRLLRYQKYLSRRELLIVDELGFVPLSKTGAEMLFEILSQRY